MKTEFEFIIPRTNDEDPCVATVSVAADPNGKPSFDILVIDRRGEYVETRADEDAEIIDKAIEKWGAAYGKIFGDGHCDSTVRERVDAIEREMQPEARESDGFETWELNPETRLRLAQQIENWRAEDKLEALHPSPKCAKCGGTDVSRRHHDGNALAPECHWWECNDCGHQTEPS